ncbi:hypothetical protein BGX26_008837 [Mortierella sp. AD094]|nr:hypothetical protein BGX26_008837 [Mortierella sp. AD094]
MNLPDKGDLQLFGRPSVIGGYNLTTSILVCGFITLVFLITIAVATIKRAQFRKQFRRDIEKNKLMEAGRAAAVGKDGKGGKGGKGAEAKGAKSSESEVKEKDTSRDAVNLPSRQPSFRRALMEDARRENEDRTARTRTPDNNRNERRQDGAGIKFDTLESPIDRNGSFRNQQQPEPQPRSDRARDEMNARFQGRDRQQGVQDYPVNYDDVYQDEYTLPPLTASSTDDAYYSGGFSNAIQAYQYSSPQLPDLAYQQQQAPRPLQPVKRTGSNRLPNGNVPVASPKSLDRAPSFSRNERPRPKITTQGLVERAGSSVSSRSNSSSGSNVSSPIDRYGRFGRGGGSPVAQFEMDSYPSSIARSNNSRLPLEMRSAAGNDRGYSPSGLSQAQNGRSAGNYM